MEMFEEIKEKFDHFYDALIKSVHYSMIRDVEGYGTIDITIESLLIDTFEPESVNWVVVKLTFMEVEYFNLNEPGNFTTRVIDSALLKKEAKSITFDFHPNVDYAVGEEILTENLNSPFIVKCGQVKYEILES